jgi:hypothetical protein
LPPQTSYFIEKGEHLYRTSSAACALGEQQVLYLTASRVIQNPGRKKHFPPQNANFIEHA